MTELANRVRGLSRRERLILLVGGVSAALIVLYAFVWEPWQEELKRLRTQVPVKQETLEWMQQQVKSIAPLVDKAGKQGTSSGRPLLTIVEQSAKGGGMDVFIRRMAPGEGDQVKLWLTEADFDKWVLWLEALRKEDIEVESATINRTKENQVTIRMTLQR